MKRPALTFPPVVAEAVRKYYNNASCILEYGSGGSTVLASELSEKTIVAVESDKKWAKDMRRYIRANPNTLSIPHILHADIGSTGTWGYPTDKNQWKKYVNFSIIPWITYDNLAPDVILIDGRFRAACFFLSTFLINKETIILFDDFLGREDRFLKWTSLLAEPFEIVDRMAIFKINQGKYDPKHIIDFARCCFDPR